MKFVHKISFKQRFDLEFETTKASALWVDSSTFRRGGLFWLELLSATVEFFIREEEPQSNPVSESKQGGCHGNVARFNITQQVFFYLFVNLNLGDNFDSWYYWVDYSNLSNMIHTFIKVDPKHRYGFYSGMSGSNYFVNNFKGKPSQIWVGGCVPKSHKNPGVGGFTDLGQISKKLDLQKDR